MSQDRSQKKRPLAPSEGPQAKLRVADGPDQGRSFRMVSDCVSIGRGGENDIVLGDPYCSRQHAVIVQNEGEFVIQRVSKQGILKIGKKEIKKSQKLKHKSALTLGQTQISFEILKEGEMKPLPHPLVLAERQASLSRKKTEASSFGGGSTKPWIIRGAMLMVLGGFLYMGLQESPDGEEEKTQEEAFRLRTQEDREGDIKSIDELQLKLKEEKSLMKSNKNAHIAYLKGIRDYRQGLFGRARENFRVCQTLHPSHKLCSHYLKKSTIKYEKLAQRNMVLGKQYRDQNQFRQCASSFKNVWVMMSYNKSHPLYSEAKSNFNFCITQLEEIY